MTTRLYFPGPLTFVADESPITLGDNKFRIENVPFDGTILGNATAPKIEGCIKNAGTGAGTATQFQIRVVEQDRNLLSSPIEFPVDDKLANNRGPAKNMVLASNPSFKAGQTLALDCDGLCGGSNSEHAVITVWCGFWYDVED